MQDLVEARVYATLAFVFLVFIGVSSIIAIVVQYALYSHELPAPLGPRLDRKDMPVSSKLGIFSPFYLLPIASIVLAVAVYFSCLKPLRENTVPRRETFTIMIVLGYVFGMILAGILLTLAYLRIYKQTE